MTMDHREKVVGNKLRKERKQIEKENKMIGESERRSNGTSMSRDLEAKRLHKMELNNMNNNTLVGKSAVTSININYETT